jgi:hypothetical protein
MFALAQLLRNRYEQRPSNQGELDSIVTEEVTVYYNGAGPDSGFILGPQDAALGLRFKWYAMYCHSVWLEAVRKTILNPGREAGSMADIRIR